MKLELHEYNKNLKVLHPLQWTIILLFCEIHPRVNRALDELCKINRFWYIAVFVNQVMWYLPEKTHISLVHIGDWKYEILCVRHIFYIFENLSYPLHSIFYRMEISMRIVLYYVITRHPISLEVKIIYNNYKKLNIFNSHSPLNISTEAPPTCHSPLKSSFSTFSSIRISSQRANHFMTGSWSWHTYWSFRSRLPLKLLFSLYFQGGLNFVHYDEKKKVFKIFVNVMKKLWITEKPHSHSRMKSCECVLIPNVNGYSSIRSVIRQFAALFINSQCYSPFAADWK